MAKLHGAITWLETGIELYQNWIKRVESEDIKEAFKEMISELKKAIKIIKET